MQGNNTFNRGKKDEKTVILNSFQPHGRWFSEIRKDFISYFPCVLDFQNTHPKYPKLSPVTGECCQISFGSILDSFDSISSKEIPSFNRVDSSIFYRYRIKFAKQRRIFKIQ